jgi:hypothetical protein
MKRNERATYRVRPAWHDGSWLLQSPDLDGLLLRAPMLQHVESYARQSVASFLGLKPWSVEIAVLPAIIRDTELHGQIERALAAQANAKLAAQEASDRTFAAMDVLSHAGMDMVDIGDLLGMSDRWHGNHRPRPSGIAAIDDEPWLQFPEEDDDWGVNPWERLWGARSDAKPILAALAAELGGAAELAVVNDEPLPDEPFSWAGIADDVFGRVAEVLVLCDHACDALFDVEARTAVRRALAQLARYSPKYFRRSASAAGTAAALCWTVGKANRLFSTTQSPRIGELGALLGTTGPSSRARTLMPAAGFEERSYNHIVLGSADMLVSAHRRRIIEKRDAYSLEDSM